MTSTALAARLEGRCAGERCSSGVRPGSRWSSTGTGPFAGSPGVLAVLLPWRLSASDPSGQTNRCRIRCREGGCRHALSAEPCLRLGGLDEAQPEGKHHDDTREHHSPSQSPGLTRPPGACPASTRKRGHVEAQSPAFLATSAPRRKASPRASAPDPPFRRARNAGWIASMRPARRRRPGNSQGDGQGHRAGQQGGSKTQKVTADRRAGILAAAPIPCPQVTAIQSIEPCTDLHQTGIKTHQTSWPQPGA
jgi:hypothetical protein